MKISGCTYLRNGEKFGYPFVESICSVLPLVDEFIVALGPCEDETEQRIRRIGESKIRIINTQWNESMRNVPGVKVKAFVYGQQRSIAMFNCTGDWALYLDADELLHEQELPKVRGAMEKYLEDQNVEALVFDYLHFYGNANTYAWSPGWYRTAARIVRNTIPYWTPKGMAFIILKSQQRGRYPRAAHTGATMYHYGWVRGEAQMKLKTASVSKFGRDLSPPPPDYSEIDASILRRFEGTHPRAIQSWLAPAEGLYQPNLNHRLTSREKKHRLMLKLENWFGIRFNKKHYTLIR